MAEGRVTTINYRFKPMTGRSRTIQDTRNIKKVQTLMKRGVSWKDANARVRGAPAKPKPPTSRKIPRTVSGTPPVQGVPWTRAGKATRAAAKKDTARRLQARHAAKKTVSDKVKAAQKLAKRKALYPETNPNVRLDMPATSAEEISRMKERNAFRREHKTSSVDTRTKHPSPLGTLTVRPAPAAQPGTPAPSETPWSSMEISKGTPPPPEQQTAPAPAPVSTMPATRPWLSQQIPKSTPPPPLAAPGVPAPVQQTAPLPFSPYGVSPPPVPGFPWSSSGSSEPDESGITLPSPAGMSRWGSPGTANPNDPYAALFN